MIRLSRIVVESDTAAAARSLILFTGRACCLPARSLAELAKLLLLIGRKTHLMLLGCRSLNDLEGYIQILHFNVSIAVFAGAIR